MPPALHTCASRMFSLSFSAYATLTSTNALVSSSFSVYCIWICTHARRAQHCNRAVLHDSRKMADKGSIPLEGVRLRVKTYLLCTLHACAEHAPVPCQCAQVYTPRM